MSLPDLSLSGKVALVTGGGRGIGKAIALTFAEAGADVAVASRTQEEIEQVAKEIRALGRKSLAVRADVSRKEEIEDMVKKVADEFGGIDILVNNAGTTIVKSFAEHSAEDWDKVMDVNLRGYYICSREVGKLMIARKKGGNIISIASMRGLVAATGRVSYSVSKAAVIMLTRVLALELVDHNIRVNAIAPGWIKTRLTERFWKNPTASAEILATVPMKKWGELSDIANAALYLASDMSAYVTGQTIVVDGGISAA